MRLRDYRYTKSIWLPAPMWETHPSDRTAVYAYRSVHSAASSYLPVWQHAVTTQADIVYCNVYIPNDIYRPDGFIAYATWIPGASWTTGDYDIAASVTGATLPYTLDGANFHDKEIYQIDITPSAATELREDHMSSNGDISIADDDTMLQMRFYCSTACTADDILEFVGLRLEYTAWRAGVAMHPASIVG